MTQQELVNFVGLEKDLHKNENELEYMKNPENWEVVKEYILYNKISEKEIKNIYDDMVDDLEVEIQGKKHKTVWNKSFMEN